MYGKFFPFQDSDHQFPFSSILDRETPVIGYLLNVLSNIREIPIDQLAVELGILRKSKIQQVTNLSKEESFDPTNEEFFPTKLMKNGRLIRPPRWCKSLDQA